MPYNIKFFIETLDLKEKLSKKEQNQLRAFTILANSLLTEFDSLKLTTEAYPKEFVRNLVCLRPGRLMEHEILAQLQATIKLDKTVEDEADTFGRAFTLVQASVLKNNVIESECVILYAKTAKELDEFFDGLIARKQIHSSQISPKDQAKLKSMFDEIAKKEPWVSDPNLLKLVCMQRGLAFLYTQEARKLIEPLVRETIQQLCQSGTFEPLDLVDKKHGVAVFTTGGVASGKGTCLANIESTLTTRIPTAIAWNDMVHHNADRLKPFLLDPGIDPKKFSQYTYEESLLVKERIMMLIEEQGKVSGFFPHFMHDQTKLKADELKQANQRYGEIIIAAVSTDASVAIERSYLRGMKTKRFEHTEGLLGSHQAVPGEFIKALTQDELFGQNKISVVMYDNNSPSKEINMFASINMLTKTIVVYDEEQMQNWIKKETINIYARSEEELYFQDKLPIRSTMDYFDPLIKKGFQLHVEPGMQKIMSI
ncbi:MAG: hypothetical protein WC627_08960 [Legionella sp.]|jgi:hypothetical protein